MNNPSMKDWNDLTRLMKHLKSTREQKLILRPDKLDTVTAYIDASFGVHADMKEHGGYVVLLRKAPIYAKASASKLNTKSSTEEELVAVHDYSNIVIWMKNFLGELDYGKERGIIKQDNTSTMDLIYEGRSKAMSTKHIDRRHFYVKDLIDRKWVIVVYCRTDMMIADLMAKPLSGFYYERQQNKLMNFGNVTLIPLCRKNKRNVNNVDNSNYSK